MLENIILDLRREFEAFKFQTNGRVVNFKEFAKEVISTILDYISDATQGEDRWQEFVDTMEKVASQEGLNDAEARKIATACAELAEAMFAHLRDIGAYDDQGHIGFKFKELLGNDIVLQPLEPEDFGVAVEDDDELPLVDDPVVAKEMVASQEQNDLANLYADVAVAADDDEDISYIED